MGTLEERALKGFVRGPSYVCWPWEGERNPEGYGLIRIIKDGERRGWMAHRVVYEMYVGPIPEGLTLDHLCQNTGCVNPSHLEPVTAAENILRGNGPPAQNARKTRCKRGHEFDSVQGKDGRWRQCNECRRITDRLRRRRNREAAAANSMALADPKKGEGFWER